MNNKKHSLHGFTLMEIIIVVITLGVITSLALSNYSKIIERNYCRNAQMNLIAIQSAAQIYKVRNGNFSIPTGTDLDAINTDLKLNITDPNFTYSFIAGTPPQTFTATATRRNAIYNCSINETSAASLACTSIEDNFCPKVLP